MTSSHTSPPLPPMPAAPRRLPQVRRRILRTFLSWCQHAHKADTAVIIACTLHMSWELRPAIDPRPQRRPHHPIVDQLHGGKQGLAGTQDQDLIARTSLPVHHPVGRLLPAQRQCLQDIRGQSIRIPQRVIAGAEIDDEQRAKLETARARVPRRIAGLFGSVEGREGDPGPDPPRLPLIRILRVEQIVLPRSQPRVDVNRRRTRNFPYRSSSPCSYRFSAL